MRTLTYILAMRYPCEAYFRVTGFLLPKFQLTSQHATFGVPTYPGASRFLNPVNKILGWAVPIRQILAFRNDSALPGFPMMEVIGLATPPLENSLIWRHFHSLRQESRMPEAKQRLTSGNLLRRSKLRGCCSFQSQGSSKPRSFRWVKPFRIAFVKA